MWLSLVERCVRDAEVVGSNPVISTIYEKNRSIMRFFCVYPRKIPEKTAKN